MSRQEEVAQEVILILRQADDVDAVVVPGRQVLLLPRRRRRDDADFDFDVVCNSCFGVGIDETAKSEVLNAYPNPSSDVLYLDNTLNSAVNIYSIDGKMIESFISDNKLSKIDVSSLENGMYMFEVIANGGSSKGKFVINR